MRKILIASQKGGVGKTTTALNLASLSAISGQRTLLLDADPIGSVAAALRLESGPWAIRSAAAMSLPGRLWENVVPGLDVMTPYQEQSTSEAELDATLAALPRALERTRYDAVLIDSPPSLWQRSRVLLQAADEVVLVLRAEPLAYRTLPGFLEMLKSVGGARLKGILLTLSPRQADNCHVVQQMRDLLGQRAFGAPIPFDERVGDAVLAGRPIVLQEPDSAAGRAYLLLGELLGLVNDSESLRNGLARRGPVASQPQPLPDLGHIQFPGSVETVSNGAEPVPTAEELPMFDPTLPLGEQHTRQPETILNWPQLIAFGLVVGVLCGLALQRLL